MAKIALADMIEELRNELQVAMEKGKGRSLRFELGEVTLEAEVAVEAEGGAKGKFQFWIFSGVEANARAGKTQTQKLVLRLQPVAEVLEKSEAKPKRTEKVRLSRNRA